jgi:hypothetical protein
VNTVTVHEVPLWVFVKRFTVAPLQSSAAVGGVKLGVEVQSIVALLPAAPIVGACVSNAVITCVTVAEWLPQASVASHVLVKTLLQEVPELVFVSKFTVAPLQSSDAVGGVKSGDAVQSIV